jgi:Dolichyl-phosphate-mannose-protein mannosyltransferase
LAGPVAAAAGVRLALLTFVLARGGSCVLYRADTLSYLEPGRNLLWHGSFTAAGLPELVRTPGYALFLAALSVAGPVVVSFAQVILSVLSLVLVWRLARAVFADESIAIVAAWIFAFEPLSVIYSILLLSETLFLAPFLMSLIRLVDFLRGRSLKALAEAGLWLAAATFVRPVTYYLPIAIAVGLIIVLARNPALRWKAAAVLLISVLPWLVAWQIRNKVETGFGGFSSIQAANLYFFSAAEVNSRLQHRTLAEVQNQLGYNDEQLFLARHAAAAGWNQAERAEFMQVEANRVLRAHPWLFLRTHFAGSMRTAFNPGAAVLLSVLKAPVGDIAYAQERDEGPLRAALSIAKEYPAQTILMVALEVALVALYIFAVCGVLSGGAPGACLWLLLGVWLYFFCVSGGAIAAARLRLPVMPIVCVFAAAGIMRKSRFAARNQGVDIR